MHLQLRERRRDGCMENEPEQVPDLESRVDGICQAFDIAYYGLMNKIIDDMHKRDGDTIEP